MKKVTNSAKVVKILTCVLGVACIISVTACVNPAPSPEARERARVVLEETSPRNMNEHPKITCPNVGYTLPDGDCKGQAIIYNQKACED